MKMKLKIKSSKNKRMEPLAATATTFIKKKRRSKQPRRPRSRIAPFDIQKQTPIFVDCSSCSYFHADEVSCDSSRVTEPRKRKFAEVLHGGYGDMNEGNKAVPELHFRRNTRSYCNKQSEAKGDEVELSESSCVESNHDADFRVFGDRSSKMKKASETLNEIGIDGEVSVSLDEAAITRSDVSCVELLISLEISKLSSENKENDLVSVNSGFEFCSTSKCDIALFDESVNDVVDANFTASNSVSAVEQKPKSFYGLDSQYLACDEHFSLKEVVSDHLSSHETTFAELQSDFYPDSSDLDCSDYTPSIFFDSGSQFSEKSSNDSPTSLAYSLFLEFKLQFSRSTSPLDSCTEDEHQLDPALVRFEDEEDEENYKQLRKRERRQVFLRDYVEDYLFTTGYGDLILQQRSFMVSWIIEQCTAKEFQQETIFLGVCLLDRFLSKGFFKNRRSLQIVGIACLALATRIEENQPYNSVRQKNFCIESNTYSRNEVVAMEWLVMEILNFQCFLPTIYNFLWFYLKAAKADAEVEKRAKYLAVLALSDHEQLRYWPSTVAAGVVIMASMEANQHSSFQQIIEIHMRTKDNDDLPECMASLDWLIQYIT